MYSVTTATSWDCTCFFSSELTEPRPASQCPCSTTKVIIPRLLKAEKVLQYHQTLCAHSGYLIVCSPFTLTGNYVLELLLGMFPYIYKFFIQGSWGLAEWLRLSGLECVLLLQRTRVQFPASMEQITNTCNSSSKGTNTLFQFPWHGAHAWFT